MLVALGLLPLSNALAGSPPRLYEVPTGRSARLGDEHWRVAVESAPVLGGAPRLILDLPDGESLEVERHLARKRASGFALWRGRVAGEPGGDVVLSVRDGVLSGYISTPRGDWELRSQRSGGSLLVRSDRKAFSCSAGAERPAPLPAPLPLAPIETRAESRRAGVTTVDLLVLCSPQARSVAGGRRQVESRIQLFLDTANSAFARSGMPVELLLVGLAETPFDDRPIGSALPFVRTHPWVQALRDAVGADLVSVVTNGPECGHADMLQSLQVSANDSRYLARHPGPPRPDRRRPGDPGAFS